MMGGIPASLYPVRESYAFNVWQAVGCASTEGIAAMSSGLLQAFYKGWPEHGEEAEPSRYGKKAAKWIKADESMTLKQILRQSHLVIPGIPAFFVVAKGTDFRERFLAQEQHLL
jgi:hypothetical protein